MPLKSAVNCVTKMKAQQAQLDEELRQVQEEADHEEKEHVEEAACQQKKCEGERRRGRNVNRRMLGPRRRKLMRLRPSIKRRLWQCRS